MGRLGRLKRFGLMNCTVCEFQFGATTASSPFLPTVREADKASEGGDVDKSFNPQHDESSKKSPGVRDWCLLENLIRARGLRSEKSESPAWASGAF
jgi:hypothetical protein